MYYCISVFMVASPIHFCYIIGISAISLCISLLYLRSHFVPKIIRITLKGKRKGKNPNVDVSPPPTNSSPSFSILFVANEASNAKKSLLQQNIRVKTTNIHCGSMLQGNKEMEPS
jgi:hypothetical protein